MNHYLIFILGAFFGMVATFFILGLCKASGEADEQDVYANWRKQSRALKDKREKEIAKRMMML